MRLFYVKLMRIFRFKLKFYKKSRIKILPISKPSLTPPMRFNLRHLELGAIARCKIHRFEFQPHTNSPMLKKTKIDKVFTF